MGVRILVTGGLGFIGAHLAARLEHDGHEVRILDDASRGRAANAAELGIRAAPILADIRDASAVEAACEGVEAVVHLAAVQGTRSFYERPDHVLEVNVIGTLNVARACATTGVRRLVFGSSSEVYGSPDRIPTPEDEPLRIADSRNPRFSYASSKVVGESIAINFARRHGYQATVLRFHNVYGPRMGTDHVIPQFIGRTLRGEEFVVQGDGTQTRAFCYVSDAVEGTVRAALLPAAADGVFNIGDQRRECSIRELIALLERIAGRRIEPRFVPAPEGSPPRRCPDTSRAARLLGYAPTVDLEEGLRRTWSWYAAAPVTGP